MTALLLTPVALSLLVLAAHFLRAGHALLVVVVLVLLGLLFVRRRWAARAVQAALVLGALEWARATLALVGERMSMGQPYLRMVVILAAVAAVCGLSALVFFAPPVRRWFRLDRGGAGPAREA